MRTETINVPLWKWAAFWIGVVLWFPFAMAHRVYKRAQWRVIVGKEVAHGRR